MCAPISCIARHGAVLMDVVRAWAIPSVLGVGVGALIAGIAPGAVLKIAFVVITGTIGAEAPDRPRRLADRRAICRAASR